MPDTEELKGIAATPEEVARTLFKSPHGVAKVKIFVGDCLEVMADMGENSIDLILTDPPYFLDRLGDEWNPEAIDKSRSKAGVVGGLPVGMKFDTEQGRELQEFLLPIAEQMNRVLKPGGFILMFSAPRLVHRAAVALEDSYFEIRDVYAWRYTGKAQAKAFTVDHFIDKRKDMTIAQKRDAKQRIGGRRTPQLRPQFEPIICGQKQREGTFVDNWLKYETGLVDVTQTLTGRMPETVMPVEKEVKDKYNGHLTPKPVKLCEHLIRVFSKEGQIVLDPFLGSGSTCIAARKCGRRSIGIEINKEYVKIAKRRIGKE